MIKIELIQPLAEQINTLLPQTQCTRCGYQGCKPYAEALANHEADLNQCPPGGEQTIHALARLLKQSFKPLNPKFGTYRSPSIAVIIENSCIGCTKCLVVCPIDAILGASKFMHTVMTDECTGCELCLPPCPVDCIIMKPTDKKHSPSLAKQRYQSKQHRLQRLQQVKQERARKQKEALTGMIKAKKISKKA